MLGLEIHCMNTITLWIFVWLIFGSLWVLVTFLEREWKIGLVSLIIVILAIGIPMMSIVPVQWEKYETLDIVSISDGSSIQGSFILGSGYIGDCPVFISYYKTTDGGYRLIRFYADRCIVYMDENNNPHVDSYRTECGNIRHEIHVPEGTVVRQFILDSRL